MVQSSVMGVDIGHHSIKAVVLKPAGDTYTLLGYQEIVINGGIFTDNHRLDYQKIVKKLKELKKGLPRFSRKVVVAIPDSAVISKLLQIDSELETDEHEYAIHQAFSHQSPFPSEELYLDFVAINQASGNETAADKKRTLAFQVYATKREAVDTRTLAIEKAGLIPILADVQSHGLVHLWQRLSQRYQTDEWMLIDVGDSQTSLCLDLVNKAPFYKQVAMGGKHLTQSDESQKVEEGGLSSAAVDDLAEKVSKQIQLFVSVYGTHRVKGLWLCGGGACSQHVADVLAKQCDLMCGVIDPFSVFYDKARQRHRCEQASASFATATGLALRGLNWMEVGNVA